MKTLLVILFGGLLATQAFAQQMIVTASRGATGDPFNAPQGAVFDGAGNLFVADSGNHRIQRIDHMTGAVATVAGTGAVGAAGDGSAALHATLNCPNGVAFGRGGSLLIADPCAAVVRIVAPSPTDGLISGRSDEIINLFAGGGSATRPGAGIAPTDLRLDAPAFVAVDSLDSVYIGSQGDVSVVGVDINGLTWVVAEIGWVLPLSLAVDGQGQVLTGGDGDDYPLVSCINPAAASPSNQVSIVGNPNQSLKYLTRAGIAFDSAGHPYTNLFSQHSIVELNATATPCGYDGSVVGTYAGNGTAGYAGDGGPPAAANLNGPAGIAFSSAGNLFIADSGNNVIRAVIKGAATATGSAVTVSPLDQYGNPRNDITLTFDNVTTAGVIAVVVGPTGPVLPDGLQLATTPPEYFDIMTTAQFTGQIKVCFTDAAPGTQLLHFVHDIVDPFAAPATGTGVCISVGGLSPFALVTPLQQNQAAAITSANSATFTAGTAGAFAVTATGTPTPTLAESGALPSGVTFNAATGALSGTPTTAGTFTLAFTAHNGVGTDASQSFTLTVDQAPAIGSAGAAGFIAGTAGSFIVTATGFPTPSLTETGSLPNGMAFIDNHDGTATLSGTPTVGGTFPLSVAASNGVGSPALQNLVVTVSGTSSGGPIATVTPSSINFGNVHFLDLIAGKVNLQNTGTSSLSIGSISLIYGPHTDWTDIFLINLCGRSLAPGKSCVMFVNYFAHELGAKSATLSIVDNAPGSPQKVSVTGTEVVRSH